MNYAIDVQGLSKLPCRRQGAGRCQSAGGRRRNGRLAGRVRFRQVDAAAPSGRFRRGRRGLGSVTVNGQLIQRRGKLSRQVRGARASIGFVFQQFNLVGRLPVITNVLTGMLPRVPLWRSLTRWFRRDEVRAGLDALAQVGIDDYAFQRASTLSGGQQQRAAIARTLVQNARVILADEPIASLDPEPRAA